MAEVSTVNYIDRSQAAYTDAGLINQNKNKLLVLGLFASGLILTLASMIMNMIFAASIASTMIAAILLGAVYLAFDIFKITAPSAARALYVDGYHGTAAFIVIGFIAALAASLVSGTGFMADTVERTENMRLTESSSYQKNESAQARLQTTVEDLAIAPSSITHAQNELQKLNTKRAATYGQYSRYMTEDCNPIGNYYTRARQGCSALKPIDDAIDAQQQIIEQGKRYDGALSELNRLENTAPAVATTGGANIPGFVSLGQFFGVGPMTVRTQVFVWTTITVELIAGICWLVYGMLNSPREISDEEFVRKQYKIMSLHAMNKTLSNDMGKALASDAMDQKSIQQNSDEIVQEQITEQTEIRKHEGTQKTDQEKHRVDIMKVYEKPDGGKLVVGRYYACEECDSPYVARTTWQKYCPECTKKKKDEFVKKMVEKGNKNA